MTHGWLKNVVGRTCVRTVKVNLQCSQWFSRVIITCIPTYRAVNGSLLGKSRNWREPLQSYVWGYITCNFQHAALLQSVHKRRLHDLKKHYKYIIFNANCNWFYTLWWKISSWNWLGSARLLSVMSVGGLFLETATNSLQHNAYEYSLTLQPPHPCGLDNH